MMQNLFQWYGKKTVIGVFIVVLVLSFLVVKKLSAPVAISEIGTLQTTSVSVVPVLELINSNSINLIGTVSAVSQAKIQSEASGRVTAVNVRLGDVVSVGAVIASLENASERAAVLQAEGSYEAAVAAAAQSDVGVGEAEITVTAAKNSALNIYRSTYNSAAGIVTDSIDQIFTNPKGAVPGVRVGGTSYTQALNSARVELQSIMPAWQLKSNTLTVNDNLKASLAEARTNTQKIASLVDIIILVLNSKNVSSGYTAEQLALLSIEFSGVRQSLSNNLGSIDSALTSIASAEDMLERVKLGGTNSDVSAANAQVKIALGSLRGAQANLAKTIIRSPIGGNVNEINVKTGDYIGAFTPVATVANNNALEVTTYLSSDDTKLITVGDKVTINGSTDGTVTRISPAINQATGKVEVIISTENSELKNGDTVTISLTNTLPTANNATVLRLPLTAIKLTSDKSFVFTVNNNRLVAHEVILGVPNGNMVEIKEGLNESWSIVKDARGLSADMEVVVIN